MPLARPVWEPTFRTPDYRVGFDVIVHYEVRAFRFDIAQEESRCVKLKSCAGGW